MKKISIIGSDSELFNEISIVEDTIGAFPIDTEVSGAYPRTPGKRDERYMNYIYEQFIEGAYALILVVGWGHPDPDRDVPDGIVEAEHQFFEFIANKAERQRIPVIPFLYNGNRTKDFPGREGETELIQTIRYQLERNPNSVTFSTNEELVQNVMNVLSTVVLDSGNSALKSVNDKVATLASDRQTFQYDVALSFAGEDREYVEAVAKILKQLNIAVFYDKYEEADLWGKDLYAHLDEVYQRKSKFCVIFISKHYKKKVWTNHERESAQARALSENREYILPARFDDTELPGLRATIGFIDLINKSPRDCANLIAEKLNTIG